MSSEDPADDKNVPMLGPHHITDFVEKKKTILRTVEWTLDNMRRMDDMLFDDSDLQEFAKKISEACEVFCEKGCGGTFDCEYCWIHAGLKDLNETAADAKLAQR
jgi:hypothetical protein